MVTLSETEILHQVGENGEYNGMNCCYVAVGEETGFILGINAVAGNHFLGSEDILVSGACRNSLIRFAT
jgi:hypothetical protein